MGQKKYLKELWPNFSQIWWKTSMNRPYKFSNFQENKYKWNQIYSHHSHAAKNQSKQKKTLEAPRGKRHVMYKRKKKRNNWFFVRNNGGQKTKRVSIFKELEFGEGEREQRERLSTKNFKFSEHISGASQVAQW